MNEYGPNDNEGPEKSKYDMYKQKVLQISLPHSIDEIKTSFFRWRKRKLIAGGISRICRSVMYLMLFILTLMKGPSIGLFPFALGILFGLRGIQLLFSGFFKMYRARNALKKTRSRSITTNRLLAFFYKCLMMIYIIPILSFPFILPTLTAPYDISDTYELWPLIFIGYWVIWRIVLRALIHAHLRSYMVGNNLAKVHHDKKIIRRGYREIGSNLVRFINSSYIPIITLLIIVIITGSLKVVYSIFRTFILESINVDTMADLIIDTLLDGRYSLNDALFPSFPIWLTPLLLYLINISLLLCVSYLRSRIRSVLYSSGSFRSTAGRLIDLLGESTQF